MNLREKHPEGPMVVSVSLGRGDRRSSAVRGFFVLAGRFFNLRQRAINHNS